MTSPFDAAAGAVGFASLGVLLLQGCVKGFVVLCTAQNFGKDADAVRCEIEFEQYRLFRWADKVGLGENKPNRNLNWELINDILKQLESHMSDTSKFKKEYGLELLTTDEKLSLGDLQPPNRGLRGSINRIQPWFYHETARSLQQKNNIWKRLKWAAIDKVGISMLISDIHRFIDNLYDLLLFDDRNFIKAGIEALLRHAVLEATDTSELAYIEQLLEPKNTSRSRFEGSAVKTALGLKQKRLILGFGEEKLQSSALSSSTTLTSNYDAAGSTGVRRPLPMRVSAPRGPLSYKLLNRSETCIQKGREIATYNKDYVLVEWKMVERKIETKLKHRIKTLAALLQEIDPSSFHSLKCLGYLKDSQTGNYGYVFQFPPEASNPPIFETLAQNFAEGVFIPSLNDRIALAITLVETVLQLHTSGWLHKGMRPENILLFSQSGGPPDIARAVLEGYEYARADNPSDLTESPISQQDANLYRHPALLRAERASFVKAHDLYALGCVLLEIGLWYNMETVLLHFVRREKTASNPPGRVAAGKTYASKLEMEEVNKSRNRLLMQVGRGSIAEAVEFAVGTVYMEIVRSCLTMDNESGVQDEEDEEDGEEDDVEDDKCLDLELEILARLRSLGA